VTTTTSIVPPNAVISIRLGLTHTIIASMESAAATPVISNVGEMTTHLWLSLKSHVRRASQSVIYFSSNVWQTEHALRSNAPIPLTGASRDVTITAFTNNSKVKALPPTPFVAGRVFLFQSHYNVFVSKNERVYRPTSRRPALFCRNHCAFDSRNRL